MANTTTTKKKEVVYANVIKGTKRTTLSRKLAFQPTARFIEESAFGVSPVVNAVGGKGDKVIKKPSKIVMPQDIAEQTGINGYFISRKFSSFTGLKQLTINKKEAIGKKLHKYASLAAQIASDGDGAPTVGENYIKIWINGSHTNAGSEANYIRMYFGGNKVVNLWGIDGTRFPKGWWIQWDLNNVNPAGYMESIHTDKWDDITMVNDSNDGILINRIKIVHSSVTILDWNCNAWLDNSKMEAHGRIGLTAPILENKLSQINNSWIPQIHWAARELGKTDGSKYGSNGAWCSEFASWCLRKEMWGTPAGNIGSQSMENYFNSIGRKYTKQNILNGNYTMSAGDYVRFQWSGGGQHSAIFMEYIDSASSPTNATRFRTIEGNTGSTVAVRQRTLSDVLSVGNTR